MTDDVLLIPNLGAEEGAGWGAPAYGPRDEVLASAQPARELVQRTATRLWRGIFGAATRCVGQPRVGQSRVGQSAVGESPVGESGESGESGDSERAADEFWPECLGIRNPSPSFEWLDVPGCAVAWLNTPAARQFAQEAQRRLFGADPEVVRVVHDKAFAHRVAVAQRLIPACLEPCIAQLEPDLLRNPDRAIRDIEAALVRWPAWTQGRFTLKPRFGTSGRGRIAGVAGRVAEARGGLARLAEAGGALLEPWLKRAGDLSAQFWIGPDRRLVLLGTSELLVEASGLYRGHRGFVDARGRVSSGSPHEAALLEAAARIVEAAAEAGYHGPCGVDAFAFEVEPGRVELRPVVEFNARFTLGIVAIGWLRRALPRIRQQLALEPGAPKAFLFRLDAPAGGWPAADAATDLLWVPLAAANPGAPARSAPGLLIANDRDALERALALQRAMALPQSDRLH